MQREFDVLFKINGAMDGAFSNAIRAAQRSLQNLGRVKIPTSNLERLQQRLQNLTAGRVNLEQFKNLQNAVTQNAHAVREARQNYGLLNREYQNQKKQTEQMRQAYDRLNAVYRENKSAMSVDQQVTFRAQIRAAREELAAQQNRERAAKSAAGAESGKADRLTAKLREQQSQLQNLRASLSAAGVSLSQMSAAESRLQAKIDRTTAALQRQHQISAAQARQSAASQNFSNAFGNFQNATSVAGTIMSPFKGAINTAMEFEHVMSEVKSLTQMDNIRTGNYAQVEKEMAALTEQAKHLGATTTYTMKEVGEAQAYVARTGWNTNQILGSTEHFLKLAAAGNMDIARTADIATNIMTAFGIGADQVGHTADVLAYTFTHSNQDLEQLGTTMKYVAPVAKMFGSSLEETASLTKFMADAGIQGSQAGTSLRQIMLRLVAPPKKATKAMEENGIAVADCMKEWQNANDLAAQYGITMKEGLSPGQQMASIIEQIDKNMAGMSNHEKMAAFNAITGINAVSGAMNLFGAGADKVKEFTEKLRNCDGSLEQTYQVMTDDAFGAQKSMESAFEAMSESIGEALLPTVKSAMQSFTGLFQGINEFVTKNPELVAGLAKGAAAASALAVGVTGFFAASAGVEYLAASAGVECLAASYQALKLRILETSAAQRVMAASQMTWGGMFAGISARAAAARASVAQFFATATAGSLASGAANGIRNLGAAFLSAGRAAMGFAFSPIGVALMALGAAGYYVYTHWSQVAPVFNNLASTLGGSLSGAISTIQGSFSSLGDSVSRLGPALSVIGGGIFSGLAVGLNAVVNLAGTLISTFANAAASVISLFSGVGNAIASALAGNFSKAGEYLKNALVNAGKFAVDAIKSLFGGLAGTFTNFFKPLDILNGSAKVEVSSSPAPNPSSLDSERLVASISSAISAAQKENQNADFSKIESALANVAQQVKDDPKTDPAVIAQTVAAAVKESQAENPEANFSQLESALTNAVSQIQQSQQAQTEQTKVETEQVQAGFDATAQSAQTLDAQFATSQGTLANFDGAVQGTNGGLESLSASSSSAASSISGLGSAASSAISAMNSAASSISAAAASASAAKPAANAEGGIYSKGAFLTTFAEKSPEAAIPIDNSKRAVDLWTKTGQMLGQLPGKKNFAENNSEAAQKVYDRRAQKVIEMAKGRGIAPPPSTQNNSSAAQEVYNRRVQKVLEQAKGRGTGDAEKGTGEGGRGSRELLIPLPTSHFPDKNPTSHIPNPSLQEKLERLEQAGKYLPKQKSLPNYSGRARQSRRARPRAKNNDWMLAHTSTIPEASPPMSLPSISLPEIPKTPSIENIFSDLTGGKKSADVSTGSINVNFSVTIQGNANAQDVEQGIRQTFPMFEQSFEKIFSDFNHEKARRAF